MSFQSHMSHKFPEKIEGTHHVVNKISKPPGNLHILSWERVKRGHTVRVLVQPPRPLALAEVIQQMNL
jgi:hypothetical protein